MALGTFEWYLAFALVLQVTVGIRLALERAPWARAASALFLLNAALTPAIDFRGGAAAAVQGLEGVTAALLLVLAWSFPTPRPGLRWIAVGAFGYVALVSTWFAAGGLGFDAFSVWVQGLPVLAAYGAFVWLVAIPFALGRSAEAGHAWIVAAFVVRIADFHRFLSQVGGTFTDVLFDLFVLGVVGSVAILAGLLLRSMWRAPLARLDAGIVLLAIGVGATLGAASWFPASQSSPTLEAVQRSSLVVLRPLLVSVGVLGLAGAARLFLPLGMVAAFTVGGWLVFERIFTAPHERPLLLIMVTAAGLGSLLVSMTRLPPPHPPRESLPASAVDLDRPRWEALLVLLQEAPPGHQDERFTRSGLGPALGVAPRNVHRVVEDANEAGQGLASGAAVVEWTVKRGRAGQLKFFYHLTPAGQEVAAGLEGTTVRVSG